jgi:hypothetical protein
MADPQSAKLREYRRLANNDVLANTFNPNATGFRNIDYVQDIAEQACRDAKSAFGKYDPIYVEALINLALFFWRRRKDPEHAQTALSEAMEAMATLDSKELLAELLAARILVQVQSDPDDENSSIASVLTNTVPIAVQRRSEPAPTCSSGHHLSEHGGNRA